MSVFAFCAPGNESFTHSLSWRSQHWGRRARLRLQLSISAVRVVCCDDVLFHQQSYDCLTSALPHFKPSAVHSSRDVKTQCQILVSLQLNERASACHSRKQSQIFSRRVSLIMLTFWHQNRALMQSICTSSKLKIANPVSSTKRKKPLEELTSLWFNLHILDIYPLLLQAIMWVLICYLYPLVDAVQSFFSISTNRPSAHTKPQHRHLFLHNSFTKGSWKHHVSLHYWTWHKTGYLFYISVWLQPDQLGRDRFGSNFHAPVRCTDGYLFIFLILMFL